MHERSWTTADKEGWGDGPWMTEPDKIQWVDDETDLDCLIVRGPMGALCGYVGVPPEHPWHKRRYGDGRYNEEGEWDDLAEQRGCPETIIDIHGGLTYTELSEGVTEDRGVCHVPLEGRPHNVWWFGFDCAHSHDLAPVMAKHDRERGDPPIRGMYETYRDVPYVRREVESLARQLAALA